MSVSSQMREFSSNRTAAFFEALTARTPRPPQHLLTFLSHLTPDARGHSRLFMQRTRPGNLLAGNASIFPSHTPDPSQGTPLSDNRDKEAFGMICNPSERSWKAVYKMSVFVLYMVTEIAGPLLCITVLITLRHKPLPVTALRKALSRTHCARRCRGSSSDFLLPTRLNGATDATRPRSTTSCPPPSAMTTDTLIAYSGDITSMPPTGSLPHAATLHKSFRKTLKTQTHMGLCLRMRTVFRVVGNEEHTVVVNVEVEILFSGASSTTPRCHRFEVERVDGCITGTGASASFIGWGDSESDAFFLDVGPRERVNLLCAVSFLRGPEVDEFSLARPGGVGKRGLADELQRAVTIHLITRPLIISVTAVAGSKRQTLAALETPLHEYAPTVRASPLESDAHRADTHIPNRASYISPSVAFQASFPRSLTTFDPLTSPPLPLPPIIPLVGFTHWHSQADSASTINVFLYPPTPRSPACPAYPNSPGGAVPSTPFWQTPFELQSGPGTVGPSVKIRRERGGSLPQTPAPTVGGFAAFTGMDTMRVLKRQQEQPLDPNSSSHDAGGEPIIVSHHVNELYPLDQFTLDIFVLNPSWTRMFEAKKEREVGGKGDVRPPGIFPLENRVWIGPLSPSTCQSVQMDFLALALGVHSIGVLTLTDIQSGVTMHLRNIIDIIGLDPGKGNIFDQRCPRARWSRARAMKTDPRKSRERDRAALASTRVESATIVSAELPRPRTMLKMQSCCEHKHTALVQSRTT
ncbi:hypothetical protein OH76DRAFT_1459295 [Lentinus brumalis]|uniref:Trafficking protein particle complex II-specific subunit 65 IgD3 domain-containing protein n=1 Tax=Lentinus brumalis TaxID=2498619 RepID=A0A371CL79_9APHY|nr:hypothetical protein OH76DRAFT_1459295 [Polyporus brumalis]